MSDAFETLAIHAGQEPDPTTGAVVVPVHLTSTYAQDGIGGLRAGYEYSRSANPTRTALEECLAALEGGTTGLAFASGMAAEDTLLRTVCRPGDRVVIPSDAYGGTYRLVSKVFEPWGLGWSSAPLHDLDAVERACADGAAVVWCETPTNPLLAIADIAALAGIAHAAGALLVVDNTFASPYLQQPLALGADVVVHSTTKYLGGHSDVVGGALVVGDAELGERLRYHQNAMGAVAGPFDAWLVLRGIKTLAVRMDRHTDNAEAIVELLVGHPAVAEVRWPGLAGTAGHELAARQMRRPGGMVSFRLRAGEAAARAVCERTRLFTLAESLGGVESLIEHPASMTHASAAGSPLEVPADLVRLSVGIEAATDLVADLRGALDSLVVTVYEELGFYTLAGAPKSPRDLIDEVRDGEAMGLGTAFISERFNVKEACTLSGAAGAVSERIRIATAATNHTTRHPMVTASYATTMHFLTGGRFVLGLGRGIGPIFDAYGVPKITTASLEDMAGLLRRLFHGEAIFGHDGPVGKFPVLHLDAKFDEDIPLGLTAFGPNTLALAGRAYDEVVLHTFFTDETVVRSVETVKRAAEEAGRDPASVKVWSCFATVGDHIDEPVRLKKTVGRLATYLQGYGDLMVKTNDWDPAVLERFRADEVVQSVPGAIDQIGTTEQLEHIATLLPDEWLAPSATGTPEQCVAAVRHQLDLGCDGVIMHGATPAELAPVVAAYAAS